MLNNAMVAMSSANNITASKVLKASRGGVVTVVVNTAGAGCTINDCATVATAAAANQIYAVPNTVGIYTLAFPVFVGLTIIIAGGAALSVSFE